LPKNIEFGYTDKNTGTIITGAFPEPDKLQTLFVKKNSDKDTFQLRNNGKYDPSYVELRCRAITEKITPEEWGTLLYYYNQRRGYNGGDDEDQEDQISPAEQGKEVKILKAEIIKIDFYKTKPLKDSKMSAQVSIQPQEEKSNTKPYVEVTIRFVGTEVEHKIGISTNSYNRFKGKTLLPGEEIHDFKVTFKDGKITNCFLQKKTDWRNNLESFEKEFEKKQKEYANAGKPFFLCHYWDEKLEGNPVFKIRNNVVLRRRYEEEFKAVWDKQSQYHIHNLSGEKLDKIIGH
jgi:hypothetical protein